MKGYDEFISIFGDVTVLEVAELLIACAFVFFVYKKISEYLIKRHDAEQLKDQQIHEALVAVRKYPEYREQSLEIQKSLEKEIQGLKTVQLEITEKLHQMDEDKKRRERSKLKDNLLQKYRYYTNPKTNPSQSWTRMEAEAFWDLTEDYTSAGGNSFIHTDVIPTMQKLTVIEHEII